MLNRFRNHLTKLIMVLSLAGTSLVGQEDLDTDEIPEYELPVFEVTTSNDRGYISTNSTSATSLDTAIRDLPMALDVVNRELIEDLQATDYAEALGYQAGISFETYQNNTAANTATSGERSPSSSVNVNDPFNNAVIIRGYPVPNQQRMGFRVGATVNAYGVVLGGTTDTSNVERLEVVKGPQSLLYGINVLSGVVNLLPRKPLPENRTAFSVSAGSDDFFRATLDITGPLRKNLNYRFVTAQQQAGDWTDYLKDSKEYYAFQIDYQPHQKMKLFLETQYADFVRKGGGSQFFSDGGSQQNTEFLNAYDERYTFGRDFFNKETLEQDLVITGNTGLIEAMGSDQRPEGSPLLVQKENRTYLFPDLGPGYRISGPDVRFTSEEFDALALLTLQPTRNLAIEVGSYYTKLKTNEFNTVLSVFNNSSQTVIPNLNGDKGYRYNPEAGWNPDTGALDDGLGYGAGELFIAQNPAINVPENSSVIDRKFGAYYWYNKPTSSESIQIRVKAAYELESDFLIGPARHVFAIGANHIEDKVSFVSGLPQPGLVYSAGDEALEYANSRNSDDPFVFRNIFDYSPIRYRGEETAIPGNLNANDLGPLNLEESSIFRSGWIDAKLDFKGAFGLYNGHFLNERLNLILGIRYDSYQAKESEQLRVIDHNYFTNDWIGTGNTSTASRNVALTRHLIGYGNKPYRARDDLPMELNQLVRQDIEALRSVMPNGTVRNTFPQDQEYTNGNMGFSFRVTEDLSVYYNFSEGIFPNTGLKDGQNKGIAAEQTESAEIGIKFELLDGRLSGSIAAYKLKRSNAVWYWRWAPSPAKWAGGSAPSAPAADTFVNFNPELIRNGTTTIRTGTYDDYVRKAFEIMGMEFPTGRGGTIQLFPFMQYGATDLISALVDDPTQPGKREEFFSMDYHEMKRIDAEMQTGETVRIGYNGDLAGENDPGIEVPLGNPLRLAMDLAIRDQTSLYGPVGVFKGVGALNEGIFNASVMNNHGSNITFEEEGTGIDGHVIFSPFKSSENYQILFSYSHQEREVIGNGFNLAPGYQVKSDGTILDDVEWTNEYDIWVYYLGPENFESPGSPSSFQGGSVKGMNLSMVPETTFRLWNKYTFSNGFLDKLSIGGGVRYDSSIPTSIEVGGDALAINRFKTPDIPERYQYDAFISYRASFWNMNCSFSLNVMNLFDDTAVNEINSYPVEDGEPVLRRTQHYYAPRSFRFMFSAIF